MTRINSGAADQCDGIDFCEWNLVSVVARVSWFIVMVSFDVIRWEVMNRFASKSCDWLNIEQVLTQTEDFGYCIG